MLPVYSKGSEAIETVYTYEEWLKEFNRRETQRRIRQRTERIHCLVQRLAGAIMTAIGFFTPLLCDNDITASIIILPLGVYLLLTRERIMTF